MLTPIEFGKLNVGLVDGLDEHDTPKGGFIKSEGFEYRRGYPRTVYGRLPGSDLGTGNYIRDIRRWVRADGTTRYYLFAANALREDDGVDPYDTFSTIISKIHLDYDPSDGSERAVTASRSSNTVTFSGTKPKARLTVQVGDYFYYNADTSASGGAVASVDSDTQVTLSAYAGSATSGAFTIWRKYTDAATMRLIVAGDRIWTFSADRRPQWYDGTLFREAGLPAPERQAAVVLAATGGLSAGDYFWAHAYEDKDGRLGPVINTMKYTAAADDKATLGSTLNGPAWAVKVSFFRTIANGDLAYCIHPNVTALLKTAVYSSPSTTLTLADDAAALVTDMHIHRYVKFSASGTSYLITDNDTTTITVTGDASGELGTDDDYISITGGYDIDEAVANDIVDFTADDELDLDYEAPTHQGQPPSGLLYPHLFLGGGRLCAYEDGTQTKVWFSGRSSEASTQTGDASAGLGEFDYWTTSHYAGRQDGDEIQGFINIGPRTFALKERSIWELYQDPEDVIEYSWFPRSESVGCLAPLSIVEHKGAAYWFGQEGQDTDVIRFDGNEAYGMFRAMDYRLGGPRLRATLDSIPAAYESIVTAAMFKGRLYVSFPVTGGTTNSKTLRFDFKTFTADVQPWGCGPFAEPYYDSTDGHVLLCGDPSGRYLESVLGSAFDKASNISRTLITGRIRFPGVPTKGKWAELHLRVINGETLAAAPTISYSVDKLAFDDSNKVWETTLAGDTWSTVVGEYPLRYRFEMGEFSDDLMLKFTSTDAKDWGIKEIEVRGTPRDQHHSMS